jgi:hypothetical protein
MTDKTNPAGLIAQADSLMHEIAAQMREAESTAEVQVLAGLMTHALLHKAFFQAVLTTRSKS